MPRLPPSVVRGSGGCNAMVQAEKDTKMKLEERLLRDLYIPELRGNALAELSKVATFIVERIVLDEAGLQYICFTVERFFALASVLQSMLISLAEQPSARLLNHIIRCYHRLTDHPRALRALRTSFPEVLKNGTFNHCLEEDPIARNYLRQLLDNMAAPWVEAPQSVPGSAAGGAPHDGPGSSQAGPSRVRR